MTLHPVAKLFLVLGAYLLGSIPFGLILSRALAGVDVRAVGSGNIGATNVARAAGKGIGILTLLLDAAKSALPVLGATSLFGSEPRGEPACWVMAVGLAAFLGHLFPVWLHFRGGKGVATGLGVAVVVAPWAALAGVCAFAAGYGATHIVSVGSLAGAVVCGAVAFALLGAKSPMAWGVAVIALAILVRHRSNIARLLRRAENKV